MMTLRGPAPAAAAAASAASTAASAALICEQLGLIFYIFLIFDMI